ncbi:hypothetical protein SRHO_G00152380 [Serrasalmus rhombeus]
MSAFQPFSTRRVSAVTFTVRPVSPQLLGAGLSGINGQDGLTRNAGQSIRGTQVSLVCGQPRFHPVSLLRLIGRRRRRRIPALSSTVLIWIGVLPGDLLTWRFWKLSATVTSICFCG